MGRVKVLRRKISNVNLLLPVGGREHAAILVLLHKLLPHGGDNGALQGGCVFLIIAEVEPSPPINVLC